MTDTARFPLLTSHGRTMLQRLREHPHAPRYTAQSGHRLTAEYLQRVRDYEAELNVATIGWEPGAYPAWLDDFLTLCFDDVPFYRRYGDRPALFTDLPTTDRADLSREPWAFVPDSAPLADLIINATSGTTGHPLVIPSHPVVGACYTPLIKAALRRYGIELTSGRGQVACILVGYQRKSFTYPSVTPHQDEAGHLKLNLHPADWRDPADRAAFLDDCNPEIYTGDPIAFAELAQLPLAHYPKALVSTAMMLTPALREQLQAHFGCPVLDMYGMNECGPIAVRLPPANGGDQAGGGHVLLQHRLFVEILDPSGCPCPPGVRGEVTLTGGLNFFVPLLRYRTNDYASLEWRAGQPTLVGLQGRPPVIYRRGINRTGVQLNAPADGETLNNLDITGILKQFALPQYTLHQNTDGSLHLKLLRATANLAAVRAALLTLFGPDQALTLEEVNDFGDKVIQYTSDLI